jgi:RNA 2',3'-cyclic 3'-phosphodiesterase
MESLRLFIALELPDSIKQILQLQQEHLKHHLSESDIHWTSPQQWHLTLKFLGATPHEQVSVVHQAMQRSMQKLEPFELSTSTLGTFPSFQRPSVLWLGIDGNVERLQQLNTRLTQNLSGFFESDERSFRAHITLGRINEFGLGKRVMKAFSDTLAVKRSWQVEQAGLYSSQLKPAGTEYTLLHQVDFALKKPA